MPNTSKSHIYIIFSGIAEEVKFAKSENYTNDLIWEALEHFDWENDGLPSFDNCSDEAIYMRDHIKDYLKDTLNNTDLYRIWNPGKGAVQGV